jgi:hypothetical protein
VQLLELGKRLLLTKSMRASPVMPSGSAAQLRQRQGSGSGRAVVVPGRRSSAPSSRLVEDLEEEHPAELADALGVAVDAGVLAHDVLDGLDEGTHLVERGEFENFGTLDGEDAFVGVFLEKGFEDSAGLVAVFCEVVALFDVVGRSRRVRGGAS